MPQPSEQRQRALAGVKSVVVKLGSQLLTASDGRLDSAYFGNIAVQVAALRKRGVQVTLVSSGAVSAGLRELGIARRPTDLAKLQAVAAVGQRRLMDEWADAFYPHHMPVAQILLTRDDIDARTRFLNLRNTVHAVMELGGVPVINENDTVSTDEMVKITFGDNDILSALVTQALRADLLVLLSVVDGVLDATGKPRRLFESLGEARSLVRTERSALGKGGMESKLSAAEIVTGSGESMVVANGREPDFLPRLLDGEEIGSLFTPKAKRRAGRNRWIGSARTVGAIVVDDGAADAVRVKCRSLLAAGVTRVEGAFRRGDIVSVVTQAGAAIARGLSNYSSAELDRIRGKKTADIRAMLAEAAYDEVIHRDNLVVFSD